MKNMLAATAASKAEEQGDSSDDTDAEAESYMADFLKDNPRRLHELVAANPLAATRCFHWTVRLVLKTLFNQKKS